MVTSPAGATNCFVCDKHAQEEAVEGGIIWADELVYAGHCHLLEQPDIHLGWLVAEPKRHVPGLEDLTTDEAAALGILITRLAGALRATEGAEHIYSFVFGDGLARGHLHVHLMPRYPGTPREHWQKRVVEWPGGPRGGVDEMRAVSQRIRAHLILTDPTPRSASCQ